LMGWRSRMGRLETLSARRVMAKAGGRFCRAQGYIGPVSMTSGRRDRPMKIEIEYCVA